MTMRERLVNSLHEHLIRESNDDKYEAPYVGSGDPKDIVLDGRFNLYGFVDAILDELQTPSDEVVNSMGTGAHQRERFVAAIRAIREGK